MKYKIRAKPPKAAIRSRGLCNKSSCSIRSPWIWN